MWAPDTFIDTASLVQIILTGKVVYRGKELSLPTPFVLIFVSNNGPENIDYLLVCSFIHSQLYSLNVTIATPQRVSKKKGLLRKSRLDVYKWFKCSWTGF